jgi:hypothetical protein
MAVGDVVNQILGVTGRINFQPAANVEVVVLSCSGGNSGMYAGFTNGTVFSDFNFSFGGTAANGARNSMNIKACVNNTTYFTITSNNYVPAFSGIQTK